jgi:hypothetical protein
MHRSFYTDYQQELPASGDCGRYAFIFVGTLYSVACLKYFGLGRYGFHPQFSR